MEVIKRTPLDQVRAEEAAEEHVKKTIPQLEQSNAALTYEIMMKDAAISKLEGQHSDLLYELMMKGVI